MEPARVLVFDLYGTLVDPLTISRQLERALPSADAQAIAQLWRRTQIEYAFRLTIMKQYRDFEWVTARSLEFALAAADATLDDVRRADILHAYDNLEPFDDVVPALESLAGAGYTLAVLSNGSPRMVSSCLHNSRLADHFATWISVDEVRAYKPDASVYRLAADRLDCELATTLLVSCNPFDIVGAKAAGARAAWVNRPGAPFDTIGDRPDITVSNLTGLAAALAP